ncbi:MAG: ABC transporter substrate-binding protein [Blastomonas fulva]|uniref:ABC transporter substrate-binding protein n=1 Tax=Blastomonas fulva TaxID=1550728 RepID=UPI0024E22F8C|nr:ABC transporter substrate-binding protein [Blastomonas fulva]MDK2756116.1 ABC transporter substrate-binding protein [Blastomonas fulva]
MIARALVLAWLLLTLAGCIPEPDPEERTRTVVVATAFPPQSLDPAQGATGTGLPIVDQLYDQLLRFRSGTAQPEIEGELAQNWQVSADGLRIDIVLKEDRIFADGSPITAGDVVWSLERVRRLGLSSAYFLEWLERAEATGERSLTLTLKRPHALALHLLAHPATSVINRKAALAGAGDTDADARLWLSSHSAGSGPYALADLRAGESVTLAANQRAATQPRQFTRARFVALPDEGVRRLLLERGDVDLTVAVPAAFTARYRGLEGVAVTSIAGGPSQSFLTLNTRKGPLANVHLRRAIAHALDYEALRVRVLKGNAVQIPGYIPPGSTGFDPAEPPPQRDLAAARAEMAAAGYKGEPLRLMVSMLGPVAEFIQSNLAGAGINVVIERRQPGAMAALARAGEFDLVYDSWTLDSPEATAMLEALVSGRARANGTNVSGYADPQVDRWLLEAAATPSSDVRAAILRQIDARLRADRPLVMIFGANPIIAYRADLSGVRIDPYQSFALPLAALTRKAPAR